MNKKNLVVFFNAFGMRKGGAMVDVKNIVYYWGKRYPEDTLILLAPANFQYEDLASTNIKVITHDLSNLELKRLYYHFFKIINLATASQVDVIISFNNLGLYRKNNIPSIVSLRTAYLVYPIKDLKQFISFKSIIRLLFQRFFFKISLKIADAIFTQTDTIKERLYKQYNPQILVKKISKAVLIGNKKPEIMKKAKNIFRFVYVTANYPHKNILTIIKAFKLLAREYNNIELSITISLEEFKRSYKKDVDINESYFTNKISFLGWLDRNKLVNLYLNSDVALVPSLFESFSGSYIETMYYELPLIVSDLDFAREICGKAAIYVAPTDEKGWYLSMKKLILDNNLREELKKNGEEQLKKISYSYDMMVDELRKFASLIIAEKNNLRKKGKTILSQKIGDEKTIHEQGNK